MLIWLHIKIKKLIHIIKRKNYISFDILKLFMRSTEINDKIRIVEGDDMIYRYTAINNCTLDLDTVEEMTKVGDSWCQERLCANLIDIRDMLFIDSKTRAYAAAQYRQHVAAAAILIDSKISSYFANIFLKFSKPKFPTRLFTIEEDAVKWLQEQIQKKKSGNQQA
jgi:hypothetical protein